MQIDIDSELIQQLHDKITQLISERDAAIWADKTRFKACEALIVERDSMRKLLDEEINAHQIAIRAETSLYIDKIQLIKDSKRIYDERDVLIQQFAEFRKSYNSLIQAIRSTPLKHGPNGKGGYGPCEEHCLKCKMETTSEIKNK